MPCYMLLKRGLSGYNSCGFESDFKSDEEIQEKRVAKEATTKGREV